MRSWPRPAGLRYLDAPVSGGTIGAAAGSLTIMAGGDPEAFATAEPIFRALGTPHLRRNFVPGGQIKSQIKDLNTILATVARFGVSMPLTSRTR